VPPEIAEFKLYFAETGFISTMKSFIRARESFIGGIEKLIAARETFVCVIEGFDCGKEKASVEDAESKSGAVVTVAACRK
jgi:ABC-type transporter Mla maintaining outer membrane lipid asymmetry permease subunit MlaE